MCTGVYGCVRVRVCAHVPQLSFLSMSVSVETVCYTRIPFQSRSIAMTAIFCLSMLVNPSAARCSPGHASLSPLGFPWTLVQPWLAYTRPLRAHSLDTACTCLLSAP